MANTGFLRDWLWFWQNGSSYAKNPNSVNKTSRENLTVSQAKSSYNLDETLLVGLADNQMIANDAIKFLDATPMKCFPFALEGANACDIQPNNNKLIVGGSRGVLSVNKDSYLGMIYSVRNEAKDGFINPIQLKKLVRINSDYSIDSTFNPPDMNGDVVSVECFNDGKILVKTTDAYLGFGSDWRLGYFLNADGTLIKTLYLSKSALNFSRDKLVAFESTNPSQENTAPKFIRIFNSNGDVISSTTTSNVNHSIYDSLYFGEKVMLAFSNELMYVYDVIDISNPRLVNTLNIKDLIFSNAEYDYIKNTVTNIKVKSIQHSNPPRSVNNDYKWGARDAIRIDESVRFIVNITTTHNSHKYIVGNQFNLGLSKVIIKETNQIGMEFYASSHTTFSFANFMATSFNGKFTNTTTKIMNVVHSTLGGFSPYLSSEPCQMYMCQVPGDNFTKFMDLSNSFYMKDGISTDNNIHIIVCGESSGYTYGRHENDTKKVLFKGIYYANSNLVPVNSY